MNHIRKVYQYAEPNLNAIGLMGVLGYPLYYVIWEYLFSQAYENLALRLACSLAFLPVLLRNHLPQNVQTYGHHFYQLAITLGLPFFFFFMMLMNDWSQVWVLSFLSASFLHILLVHITRVVLAQAIIAVSLAVFFAWVAQGFKLECDINWAHVPVFLFVYLFGNWCYSRNQFEHESRISLAKTFGAGIAHEMRNPLSCLSASIELAQATLPRVQSGVDQYVLSREQLNTLHSLTEEAHNTIISGNETIDLLLTSIDESRVSRSSFQVYSAKQVIENAIDGFSYSNTANRQMIKLVVAEDFQFLGSNTLLKYVMFNLFKNAFYHRSDHQFKIEVTLYCDEQGHHVVVSDNGRGIASEVLDNIYQDFYTTGKSSSYGLGLPFCQRVMRSFGGGIRCQSIEGKGSEFTLTFPPISSSDIEKIMVQLTQLKRVLTITDCSDTFENATQIAREMGYQSDIIDMRAALQRQSHEFEYDLIFLDTRGFIGDIRLQKEIQWLFDFTQAQIVCLTDDLALGPSKAMLAGATHVPFEQWFTGGDRLLKRLLFEPGYQPIRESRSVAKEPRPSTVMVVDDNVSLRTLTAMLLKKQGFDVVESDDGQQAIDRLADSPVDVVLMDIEMPVMDGIEAAYTIRRSGTAFANVPIIAHTGDSSSSMRMRIENSGMSDVIVKPANSDKLMSKLAHWL
ncbi:ATP-binding response regulator [Vibrio sp. WXL103]|uniref:ATP-binding response regulator n=1 Tax=unclassified Vibrio TaxID=2614977 RepID=UPI003EC7DD39